MKKFFNNLLGALALCFVASVAKAGDASFAIAGPYGSNTFDAKTESTNSEIRPAFVVCDSTANAGCAPVSQTSGLAVELRSTTLATFAASTAAFTPVATATDTITIAGSNTKTVKVTRIQISGTQTTAGVNTWYVVKRSTVDTGGTSSTMVAVPLDSSNSAATATVLKYTANPTGGGTIVGNVWIGVINSPAPATAGIGTLSQTIDFVALYGQPIILRTTAEQLALSFNGAAVPTGLSMAVTITWTEE